MASSSRQLKDLSNDGPGYLMGIISIIGSVVFAPAGLVCGIIGLKESKTAGYKNNFAIAGIIISSIIMAILLAWFIFVISLANSSWNKAEDARDRIETVRLRENRF